MLISSRTSGISQYIVHRHIYKHKLRKDRGIFLFPLLIFYFILPEIKRGGEEKDESLHLDATGNGGSGIGRTGTGSAIWA